MHSSDEGVNNLKILLVSRTEEESHILRKKLEPLVRSLDPVTGSTRDWVYFYTCRPPQISVSLPGGRTIVVLNVNDLTEHDFAEILKTRASGFSGPIIIMTRRSVDLAQREILSTEPTLFLIKPVEIQDVVGLIRKYLVTDKIESQKFPRYKTSEKARIRINPTDETETQVVNLSMGGAHLSFERTPAVRVGDRVHMVMELKQLNRTWVMPAKVVWIRQRGPGAGMGVEFVGAGGKTKNLLTV